MAKSLKKELIDISELVAIVGLNRRDVICVSLYSCGEPQIYVEALELARISRYLEMPRKKVHFRPDEAGNLHITFKARGAVWTTMVRVDRLDEFNAILSAQTPRLTAQPKRLAQPPRRLLFDTSGTT
jgi:hypothetical protein